jgi:REP element-mobilizing transposase RayT
MPSSDDRGFRIYRRRLPHWRLTGATYHVTWSLHSEQPPLEPGERTIVLDALRYFVGSRYDLHATVVMDDHVHVIVQPYPDYKLETIVQSWKSFASNRLRKDSKRSGWVWQGEYYDRIMRTQQELWETVRYVADNPRARWPDIREYQWLLIGEDLGLL